MQNNDDLQQNITSEEANSVEEEASCVVSETPSEIPTQEEPAQSKPRSKRSLALDIILWVLIAVLTVLVIMRLFVFGKITISGNSMTANYYSDEKLSTYDPGLTYHSGDVVRVNKLAKPKRGDVVVFYKNKVNKFKAMFASAEQSSEGGKYEKLIKRVVALEGDKLWVEPREEGGYALVVQTKSGNILHEDYYEKGGKVLSADAFVIRTTDALKLGCLADTDADHPYVVQDGCFFALGDNRARSNDSRGDLGDVPYKRLYGVVM